jgi:ATP-dependent helicase HrpA
MSRFSPADLQRRLANLPRPTWPEELPVVAKRGEIARAIADQQVVIVCGETGSGKTTQLPKICLELKRGVAGLIGHTQPRRIAARSVAARVASELNSPLGHAVGYKVRFSDRLSPDTYVKLMTDGILLAETQGDRELRAYDTLIIDEAHERSLNIDFLLGYVKRLLPRRPDLKLIVTSATIDAERFSRHFDGAPVIEVSGRLYPVEVRYRPLGRQIPVSAGGEPAVPPFEKGGTGGISEDDEVDMEQAIVDAVDEVTRGRAGGDVLVFLPGEREIRETAEMLRKHHPPGAEILPLFARLSFEEQDRVFRPGGARRIVLATNVAETSLTVPGIRYVVDTGLARVNRYSYRNKVEQLQVENVSRASANQRAGRCGRVAAGVCIRLYSEDDFQARPEFGDPEILRSSLASVILRMKALRLGEVESFPFLDPPAPKAIADGYQLLTELGAVDEDRALTPIGARLAKLPIDPRIGRMILAAKDTNCLTEVLIIAAALTVQDPRERPFERQEAADRSHERFQDERSDFLGFLKLWSFFEEALKHKKSNRKLIDLCHENFLSHRRMREWREVHGQLHSLATEMGLRPNETPAGYEEIHRALLAGLLGNIGFKGDESGEYLGARGIRFHIFPGSVLRKARPRWIVAAELVETARLYARCAARVEPEWIEQAAGSLASHHYFDPHWEKQPAQVVAFDRVSLYGLTLVPRRRVHYGPIRPAEAREIFIRGALVAGEFETRAPFMEHNRRLVQEVQELEHKARRQDVLVDEHTIFAFYDAIIPAGMHNGATFERWRRDAERENPKLLHLTREYLMRHAAAEVTEEQFPETLDAAGAKLALGYRFDPGHALDGVTVTVPLALLNQLDEARFEWLVPGMLRDKVAWLIKALPKQLRRNLVPVPENVTKFLEELDRGSRIADRASLREALAKFASRAGGQPVGPDAWEHEAPPPHLLMNFRVVDDAGHELASGRDLAKLRRELGQAAQLTFSAAEPGIERERVTGWDFGNLPEEISFTRQGRKLTGYPALTDEGECAAIRLMDTRAAAEAATRAGVRRLLRLELKEQMKQLEKGLPGFQQAALQLRPVIPPDDLREDLLTSITDRAFIGEDPLPRSEKEFQAQKARARTRLPAVAEAACRMLAAVAAEYHATSQRLSSAGPAAARVAHELRAQLSRLVYKGFLFATPWEQLSHLPRYLKAMQLRLDKYAADPERDRRHAPAIAALWDRYQQRLEKNRNAGAREPKLEEFRWQIEELRVSLFAQELRTPYPVSIKRLEKFWTGLP